MSPPGALANRFTVADLQDATLDLSAIRLWITAACETAPGVQGLPEEFFCLAAALTRQTPAVLSTLYPVDGRPRRW